LLGKALDGTVAQALGRWVEIVGKRSAWDFHAAACRIGRLARQGAFYFFIAVF